MGSSDNEKGGSKITIVRDFIDTDRFKPSPPINKKLTNVLFISKYKKWRNYKIVSGACNKLGLKLTCVGAPYTRSHKIEDSINKAGLVITQGRGIMEAMSCGRAVLSFDKGIGDGYITNESYFRAREYNFGGLMYHYDFKEDTLATEMSKYDSNCGETNRNLILKFHKAEDGVDKILDVLKNLDKRKII